MNHAPTEARARIERELLDWMAEPAAPLAPGPAPARFEDLALRLFRIQYAHCEPYARLCRSIERTPDAVRRVSEIPAVPTGAFKEFALRCFPAAATQKTFRTSGTTTERRGELHLDTLTLYEASLLASLRRCLVPDLKEARAEMRFLAPSAKEAPDSSLSHMFEILRESHGTRESRFDMQGGRLDPLALAQAIDRANREERPLVLAGTSFAFVHLLDAVASAGAPGAAAFRLAPGSRVMETGGFKGRSRSVPRDVLRADIAALFGLEEHAVVNQYGMTELASQFYDSTWIDPSGPRRKLAPPWTRVRFVDPESGVDVGAGEVGQIVIHDLANTGSVASIQTADLGREILDETGSPIGFDVVGREEGAEARGCSIASDAMLGAGGGGA